MIVRILLLLLCLGCAAPAAAVTEGGPRVGFKTLGLWQAQTQTRADLAVWYPTSRAPSELRYGPWTIKAARNAKELPGRFPLLLLSHDSPEDRFSHHETAEALVRSGFVVAALTHYGDNMNDMGYLFTLEQLRSRVAQLETALDALLSHAETKDLIDPKRIGIIGFGVGASAALMLGGAAPDGRDWPLYCGRAERDDPYCSPWAVERMDTLAAGLPLALPPLDKRIKAAAAAAPAYGMLFTRESLRGLHIPLLLMRAESDRINRAPLHADAIKDAVPGHVEYVVIPGADAASLMSACPPSLLRDLPELCSKVDPKQRARIHQLLNKSLVRFFLEHLGGLAPETAETPPPQTMASEPQQAPPAPVQSEPKTKGKKRKNPPAAP